MTLSKNVTDILNGLITSIKSVMPFEVDIEKPTLFAQPFSQHSVGVLIGMTGDVRGRIIIDGSEDVYGNIGEGMFGMKLEGDMLESFAGELGNMVAGNLSTTLANQGLEMDITPPTVIVGQTKVFGFEKAFRLPIQVGQCGDLTVVLMVETGK